MPRGDGTGPMGMGAMSGRAAGYCAGYGTPGFASPAPGRRFGAGVGRGRGSAGGGRGWRHWFYATGLPGWMRFSGYTAFPGYPAPYRTPDPETEKQALKNQADALQSQLDFVRKRLAEIEVGNAEE
jgi:hypothetical protein